MVKPVEIALGMMAPVHVHNGELKDDREMMKTMDDNSFMNFFESLALSTCAGFEDISDDPKLREKWSDWLGRSDAKLEWRNSKGKGPYNEGRASFTVAMGIKEVREYLLNRNCDLRHCAVEHRVLERDCERSNRRVLYTARCLPSPLQNRDYIVEQFHDKAPNQASGEIIVSRSVQNEVDFLPSLKQSSNLGYMRVSVKIKGFLLWPSERFGKACTQVVYVFGSERNGVLSSLMSKSLIKRGLRHVVNDMCVLSHLKLETNLDVVNTDFRELKKLSKKKIGNSSKMFSRSKSGISNKNLLEAASLYHSRDLSLNMSSIMKEGGKSIELVTRKKEKGLTDEEEVQVDFDIFSGGNDTNDDDNDAWFENTNKMYSEKKKGNKKKIKTEDKSDFQVDNDGLLRLGESKKKADDGKQNVEVNGWQSATDQESGGTYFYNRESGEVSWETPQESASTTDGGKPGWEFLRRELVGDPVASSTAMWDCSIKDWVKMKDGKSGFDYYENAKTGQTSWEAPEGFEKQNK